MPKQSKNSAKNQPFQQVTSVSAGPSMQSSGNRSVPTPNFPTDDFQAKLAARISGKQMSRLFTIEIFSGTGGLTAAVRRMGLAQSIGIDAHVTKQVKSPVIRINLAEETGQTLLWRILQNDNIAAVHMGPPCGTSSRARGIKHKRRYNPPPLRSTAHPDGLCTLTGTSLEKVRTANRLYLLCSQVMEWATANGIIASIENPLRSHAWATSYMQKHLYGLQLYSVEFHHCMYGARRKRTKVLCNHHCLAPPGLECDGNHPHDAWGVTSSGSWATATEVEYPHQLCQAWAQCLYRCFLSLGAIESPQELVPNSDISLVQASKVATGTQPRGKKLKPLMREYDYFLTIQGPQCVLTELPTKCNSDTPVPTTCTTSPHSSYIPAQAKRIKLPYQVGEKAEFDRWETVYGIAWTPQAFIARAAGRSHPGHFLDGVHPVLKSMFDSGANKSLSCRAKERSEQMRKWITRASELARGVEDGKGDSPCHAKAILAKKNLKLFEEMISASGSPDIGLAKDVARGFNLMGDIPTGSIYPDRPSYATLLPEQVRRMADVARPAIWEAAKKIMDPEVAAEVHRITLEERDKGWLRGPFAPQDLPKEAILTRRFGVKQSSTLSDGSRTMKVRPIDDFSESLVNSTNSCAESIQPMAVDSILATMVYRDRSWGHEKLTGKTIDLRKAYKNLPLAIEALGDAYLCVMNPETGEPEAFQTLVLPFGARAAVMGFCRTSYALWRIGVSLFGLHWTVFFDDYFLVASELEERHVDMAQRLLFQILGWETSSEKEAEFRSISKILGVQIDLSDSKAGLFSVCNVAARAAELTQTIDSILERGQLTSAEMRVLRGRLVFAESQIFGRLSGLHMQNLSRWEHAVGAAPIDVGLKVSLMFLRDRVVKGEPRTVDSGIGKVFHLYTDACYENGQGGLGGVLYNELGEMLSYFSAHVTEAQAARLNPLGKDTIIFELEALAALTGTTLLLHSAAISPADRIVVFLDNDGVLGRIISGRSGLGLDGQIIQGILEWEQSLRSVVWYERVPSAANIADLPSREILDGFDVNLRIDIDVDATVDEILIKETANPNSK